MTDIRDVLQHRSTTLVQSLRNADEFNLAAAKPSIKRKRAVRATLIGTAAAVTAVVVGVGAWAGYGALNQTPVASPTPSATPSDSPEPSVTPSPSVTPEPEHQIVSGADVEILERLENPTTGETWHEPEPVESLNVFATDDWPDSSQYFAVGERGNWTIVAAVREYYSVYSEGFGIMGLFEVRGSEIRWIACPSARSSDPCSDSEPTDSSGFVEDRDTHYDSLTYPAVTSPAEGWNLGTAPDKNTTYPVVALLGTANAFPGVSLEEYDWDPAAGAERVVLAKLGASTLVEFRKVGEVPGTTAARTAIETAFGSVIWPTHWNGNTWQPSALNGAWYAPDSVTWDDGKDTFTESREGASSFDAPRPLPASEYCFAPDEALIEAIDPDEWTQAGTHAEGVDVYLPASGGNDLAKATWSWLREKSWADDIEPDLAYPFDTYEEFLEARSVFAWQRPDGEWVLAINSYAAQRVYECA